MSLYRQVIEQHFNGEEEMEQVRVELPALKRAYNKAVKLNKETFTYNGYEYLTSYAKYVIQFLEKV